LITASEERKKRADLIMPNTDILINKVTGSELTSFGVMKWFAESA